jgi:glutamate decarboxylase
MVHLAAVKNDSDLAEKVNAKIEALELGPEDVDDDEVQADFGTTVYGSKFAAMDIPKHEMPEGEMPRDVAYRLIKYATPPP